MTRTRGPLSQSFLHVAGRTLSYVDFGGAGVPVLVIHGSFGRGTVFTRLAGDLAGQARVIALDQRGHGLSDHTPGYRLDDFVEDAAEVLRRVVSGPAVVLGHSFGGIVAYHLAARYPELVTALVIEDVGPVMRRPEVAHPVLDVRGWPATAPTREALAGQLAERGIPDASYFLHSAVQDGDHWRFLFEWDHMMEVQESGVGDWWSQWLSSTCPALVLHGAASPLLSTALAERMVERRPHTRLVTFPTAGHWVHDDDPDGMALAVGEFLRQLG